MSDSSVTFAALGLRGDLVDTLIALGYEAPTPIQGRTIPVMLEGRDLIGQAQTGTGKTAAFALPILQNLDVSSNHTQALILTPTRELAMQVAEAFHTYAKGMKNVSVLPVYGGAPIVHQLKRLDRGVQIVVGTPGRLIDHLDRKTLRLDNVKTLVLDEADEMLKMGFIEEVERILSTVPSPRQVALFSATMPAQVLRIAKSHLNDPVNIEIEHKAINAPAIEQRFLNVSEAQKLEVLTQILELEESEAVLIFRRTKNGAAELSEKLQARGFASEAMHGDMTQTLRESVIRRVRNGQVEIVVATDVAARGLDVDKISHVINYDVPNDVEVYVHRIGRTGRAGRSGVATLFITPRERRMMREIEKFTSTPIKPMKMPTRADVTARRISVFKETIRKNLQQGDLDLYVNLVEEIVDEGQFDMAEVAAAAARMANTSRSLVPEPEPVVREYPPAPRRDARARSAGGKAPSRPVGRPVEPASRGASFRSAVSGRPSREDEGPKVRLSMAVGKRDGIRPADIVGSIANEADVPGREIGPIDIRDDITIVVIPEKYRAQVLAGVKGAQFRGRPLDIKLASEGSEKSAQAGRAAAARPPLPSSYGGKKPMISRSKSFAPAGKKPFAKRGAAPEEGVKKPFYSSFAKSKSAKPGKKFDKAGPKKKR
jgi:ATP-dependent RNA helicase DeaD